MSIKLNTDICSIIANFIYKPKYILLDWININDLNWITLSTNPNAIDLLMENPDKIHWQYLSMNSNAIELLKENPDKIDYKYLNVNTSIHSLKLRKNIDLSYNSSNKDIFILKDINETTDIIKKTLEIILT